MRANRSIYWVLLFGLTLLALAAFVYPLYVMMPLRAQGARELVFSLAFRKWAPAIATTAAAGAVIVAALRWRASPGLGQRVTAALLSVSAVAFAALCYVNIYEKVFHGVRDPVFVPASEAKVEADDMVLTVNVKGAARAYPVRMMGYHHMVNDRVGGLALIATY